VHESDDVKLTDYPGTVRQLIVTGLGRDAACGCAWFLRATSPELETIRNVASTLLPTTPGQDPCGHPGHVLDTEPESHTYSALADCPPNVRPAPVFADPADHSFCLMFG